MMVCVAVGADTLAAHIQLQPEQAWGSDGVSANDAVNFSKRKMPKHEYAMQLASQLLSADMANAEME